MYTNLKISLTTDQKILESGRLIIHKEAAAIQTLADQLDTSFIETCKELLNITGRIILTGMGKSGHIAKKIAATFASTGSPAFFLHPAEAQHGDIGMLTKHDAILLISHSGETEELKSIIPNIQRLQILIITMTSNPDSTLAKTANILLNLNINQEACPLGLAPTNSTTAALVMGDALAMTLLQMKGFTKQDFALSHPSGRLGKRLLLKAGYLMHKKSNMPFVYKNATVKQSLVEITEKKLGMTAILNDDHSLIGVFTDGDLRRTLDADVNIQKALVIDHMTAQPKTINPDTLAYDALQLMNTHKITSLVVVGTNFETVGILHIHDILRSGVA